MSSIDQPSQNSNPDAKELYADLAQHRTEALANYFSQVRERLKRIACFRLDYRLRGRVSESDVVQETYVRAAHRLDGYLSQPDVPVFVWLRMELTQKLQELHRFHLLAEKRDVRREVNLASQPASGSTSMALAAHIVGQWTSPSRILERAQQIEALEKSLNEMNELDREVIALRNYEELSNVETAQVLRISPEAASKRYLRTLKRLREIVQSHNVV